MNVLENEPSFQGKHSSTLIKAQVSIFLDMYLILSFLGAKAGSQFLFKRHPLHLLWVILNLKLIECILDY